MKKILFVTLLSIGLLSCSNDDFEAEGSAIDAVSTSNAAFKKGNTNSQSAYKDYTVDVAVSSTGEVWTYTISKTTSASKNLSHFIIDLQNCGDDSATFADILYATTNGEAADLKPSEGSGTECNPQASTNNFVKINVSGSGPWIIEITFQRGYEVASATSWIKAGNACNTGLSLAPGCPKTEYCSFSQGFFFANGGLKNGSEAYWTDGLKVGNYVYTHEEAMTIWRNDRGRGGNQVLNGFFQLGAVRLSGVESNVQDQVNIIEAYFTPLNKIDTYLMGSGNNIYYNLPTTSGGYTAEQVAKAGGIIGKYVDDNHCQD